LYRSGAPAGANLEVVFPKVVREPVIAALLRCFARVRSRYWRVSVIMPSGGSIVWLRVPLLILLCFAAAAIAQGQGAKQSVPETPIPERDGDHVKERNEWFFRGRLVHGKVSAELRRRAYLAKLQLRAQHAAALAKAVRSSAPVSLSFGAWVPLGPVPLASDATGNGTQDYHQVAGRATAIAIDPADPSGNTVYIGGAQSGVWKSTNAANNTANSVLWAPITDDQATLSIGAIGIQPGNTDPAQTVILAATGEADNSGDSYFGLGILRSADGGNSWTLIPSANGGGLSFSGLGGTRMAFSAANGQTNTVVSAMATTSEGMIDGAITAGTIRGLYTSLDAGQTWNYNSLVDPGGATDATSATSVVYNAGAGLFFAAVRYHGLYSSRDGVNWTRLAAQPGGAALSTAACPPQSTSNNYGCPIYRAEITAVPGRNEMYAWVVYLSAGGSPVDGGIWLSANGGASWSSISDSSIANCGDFDGCGVQQGAYDLDLLAMPNGSATDLYAGAINLYKCSITAQNPTCAASPFLNLTHVYGCDPISALAHVHPDQHALAYAIPSAGSDAGNALLYFANDGGIYRALSGYTGLNTGVCSGMNQFDDLNQNLGSMTQFVSFSQDPTDPNTMLGGTQDNGSPATNQATTNPSWGNVLGGDGGYNAIDPGARSNWYASNPDVPPGGLGVQLCSSGVNCTDSGFSFVVTSNSVGGDDGAFYFPYTLDPQSASAMLVGTCRVWRGSRTGGAFTVLSSNFDTLGSGVCAGSEINQVRSLAAGGQTDNNGSSVIYATTSGLGLLNGVGSTPAGGHVWVTHYATGGVPAFSDVTGNGPQGNINPNQFPISGVGLDSSDTTGATAYVTVMGFTGGTGHVWKTLNTGASWSDFTGNLPDSPVNAVVVDAALSQVFVATDVGVFASSTTPPASWTELGPSPGSDQTGFLPNVAVTALGLFTSGGQQLLRASTYGRGIWEFNLVITPDFELAISNPLQTIFSGQTGTLNGTVSALSGYASSVALSCVAGSTGAPSTCSAAPATLTPANQTPFTITVGGVVGDYNFDVQAAGSDADRITHQVPVTLHIVSFAMSTPSPTSVLVPRGTTSPPVSFQISAAGSFNQSVTVTCSVAIAGASCMLTPGNTVNPTASAPVNMTASVLVPAGTAVNNYSVAIQATTVGAPAVLTTSFTLNVVTNPTFILNEPVAFPEVNAGSSGTNGTLSITSQDGFSGTVTLSCPATFGTGSCSIAPTSVGSYPATATLTINGVDFATGSYSMVITGTSGSISHTLPVAFNVGDYSVSGTQTLALGPGGQGTANLTLTSSYGYSGKINATCDASALVGAVCMLSPLSPLTLASGGATNFTATVSVPANAALGAYNVNIATQDTTGTPSHSYAFALTVNRGFTLSEPSAFPEINAGSSGTSGPLSITSQYGFSGTVTLNCPPTFGASSCSISPASVSAYPASATLIINGTGFVAGSYSVSVTGTSGTIVGSLAVPFNVGDYSISGTQSFSLTPGGEGTANLKLTASTFYGGMINATCDASALSGAQCVLSPANPIALATAGTANLIATINVPNNALPGTYNINVNTQDTTGAPSHSFVVTAILAQDFILTSSTPSQTVTAGQTSGPYQLTVQPVGSSFDGAVTLACSTGLPPQAQCVFSPSTPQTPGASAVDVVMSISTTASSQAAGRAQSGRSSSRQSSSRRSSIFLPYAVWLLLPGILIGGAGSRRVKRRLQMLASITILAMLAGALVSCGGVSTGGGTTGNPPVIYQITVTGTSVGTAPDAGQSAMVVLVVD
jgi:hypothetical protein